MPQERVGQLRGLTDSLRPRAGLVVAGCEDTEAGRGVDSREQREFTEFYSGSYVRLRKQLFAVTGDLAEAEDVL